MERSDLAFKGLKKIVLSFLIIRAELRDQITFIRKIKKYGITGCFQMAVCH